GHVEAGLRSNDWRMPEEHNRVVIDHISDFLFAPTEGAKRNLINDNVKGKIFVTGNTIVDVVKQNIALAKRKSRILEKLKLTPKNYFLLTLHREESVDFKENIEDILNGIKLVAENFNYEIIFPAHPRTIKRIEYFNLSSLTCEIENLKIINPLGYLDSLMLLSNSKLALTDSGGIQEESCILGVPCVTLRDNTERPETVEVGANYIAGIKPRGILKGVETMLNLKGGWQNPFGNNASKKVIDIIESEMRQK
ncbi:MAG: non-hydrolyzing UDP-N-acetylglucosamine 2-epimerase, partial [bacterium]